MNAKVTKQDREFKYEEITSVRIPLFEISPKQYHYFINWGDIRVRMDCRLSNGRFPC